MTRPARVISTPWTDPPAEGQAIEVAEGVLWMRMPLPLALDHVNVYALRDGDGWTVVDTGMSSRRSKAIWQGLMDGPLQGLPVRRVIVTHHHPDHVGLAGWFQSVYGAELVMTRTAWLLARMLQMDEQDRPCAETQRHWRRAGMDAGLFAQRLTERPFNFADTVDPMPLGFTRIAQGDRMRIGGRDWTVHTGGGHAPEHATLWSDDGTLVLAGDQIISSISPNVGVYATEPDADPLADWLESCERLETLCTMEQLCLSGHKLPFRGLPHRMRQLIENHHNALPRLVAYLETPKTAADCFPLLFRRKIGPAEYGLALVEAVAHLNHLYAKGLVSRELSKDGAWLWQQSG
ncbi:MAG: MBL fold metallo-hydrolase [Pseudomonadota bacterium]|nr:MBL fold metallo-hydrolase [Pseudomonadota bacterium]MEE3071617.1 MBL fold metallo-hydrolase [Pseudomonadota bacterium]